MKNIQQYVGETLTELELLGYDITEVVEGVWSIEFNGDELLQISNVGITTFTWSYELMTLRLSLTKYDMHKKHDALYIPIEKFIELHFGVVIETDNR